MKPILYIHHSPVFGGASRSILEAIKAFPKDSVDPYFICAKGTSSEQFENISTNVITSKGISVFDHSMYSHYRGKRWLVLLREFTFLFPTLFVFLKAKYLWKNIDFSAIHINEISLLPSVFLAKIIFNKPIVLHCRSLQEKVRGKKRRKFFSWAITKYVDRIVAIDDDCYRSLPLKDKACVIHNGFSTKPIDIDEVLKARQQNGTFIVGFVGNMMPLKGIHEYISAANDFHRQNIDNVIFRVIGPRYDGTHSLIDYIFDVTGFRELASKKIESRVEELQLANLEFTGFQMDISKYYKEMDVLCFPSYLDAVGRPVFEAGFFHVPSIVAVTEPTKDTFVPMKTGIQIPEKDSKALFDAILKLKDNPELCHQLGKGAYDLSHQYYDIKKNAVKLLHVYEELESI